MRLARCLENCAKDLQTKFERTKEEVLGKKKKKNGGWGLGGMSLPYFQWRELSSLFPVVKNQPADAGDRRDVGSSPGLGRSPRGRNGKPFQYSCLENPADRGAWWATVQRVAESQTQLK